VSGLVYQPAFELSDLFIEFGTVAEEKNLKNNDKSLWEA